MTRLRKVLLFLAGTVLALLLTVTALLWWFTSAGGERCIARLVEDIIQSNLELETEIGLLETNLYSRLVLKNVQLRSTASEDTTRLIIPRMDVSYDLTGLLNRQIQISSVLLDQPTLQLRTDTSGIWLLGNLLQESDTSTVSSWVIALDNLEIRAATGDVQDRSSGLAVQLDSLELSLRAVGSAYTLRLSADWPSFASTAAPGKIKVQGDISAESLNFSQIQLLLSDFSAEGQAVIDMSTPDWLVDGQLQLVGSPTDLLATLAQLSSTESPLITGDLDMAILLSGSLDDPQLAFSGKLEALGLTDYPQISGFCKGSVNTERVLLDTVDIVVLNTPFHGKGRLTFDSLSTFQVSGSIPAIPLEQSLSQFYQSDTDYQGIIQGSFQARGALTELDQVNLKAEFDIKKASWLGKPIPNTILTAHINDGQAQLDFRQGKNRLQANAAIDSLSDLAARLTFDFPDLAPMVPYTPLVGLSGSISGSATLNRITDQLRYVAILDGKDLEYQGLVMDRIQLNIRGVDADWSIQRGQISARQADLAALSDFINKPALRGQLAYNASITGNLDDLEGSVNISAADIWVDALHLDSTRLSFALDKQQITVSKATLFWQDQRIIGSGTVNWMQRSGEVKISTARRIAQEWQPEGSLAARLREKQRITFIDLDAEQIQVGLLDLILPDEGPFLGVLDGEIHAQIHRKLEQASFHIRGRSLAWSGQQVERLQLAGQIDPEYLILDTLEVSIQGESIRLKTRLPIDLDSRSIRNHEALTATLNIVDLELDRSQVLLPKNSQIKGVANAAIVVSGSWFSPSFKGNISLEQFALNLSEYPPLSIDALRADLDGRRVYLRELECRLESYPLKLTGQFDLFDTHNYHLRFQADRGSGGRLQATLQSKEGSISSSMKFQSLDLAVLSLLMDSGQEVQGRIDGTVNLTELKDRRQLKGQLTVRQGYLRLGAEMPPLQDVDLSLVITEDRVDLDRTTGRLGSYPFTLSGFIKHKDWEKIHIENELGISGIRSLSLTGDISRDVLDLNLQIPTMDLAVWQPFFPGIKGISGQMMGKLILTGSPQLPEMKGALAVMNLSLELPYIDPGLTGGRLASHFEGNSIHLDSLVFKQGTKGRLLLQGDLEYHAEVLPTMDLKLNLDHLRLKEPNVVKGEIDKARLSYTGAVDKYLLQGEIQMGSTSYQQKFTPQELLKLARSKPVPVGEPNFLLTHSNLRIKLRESDQISVHNNLAHIRLKPSLTIVGTLDQPVPTGRVSIEEGYILYLDRRFTVTTGTLDFQDPHRMNPIVDFHAKCQLKPFQTQSKKEYVVYIDLIGPVDAIQMNLRSEPVLDRSDILTLLTMGATRQELSQSNPNLDNAKLGKLVQDRLADYSSQKISAYTADRVGTFMHLESITIEGDLFNFGSNWGPQLVASKKVGEKTTLTYSTSVGQATNQNVKLEYEITSGVSVEGQTDQKGHSGLDLKFGWKFK